MNSKECRKICASVVRAYDWSIIPHTWDFDVDNQYARFKAVNVFTGGISEFAIDFQSETARRQRMSSTMIHNVRNVDYMFFNKMP